jgi:hypothetical protein
LLIFERAIIVCGVIFYNIQNMKKLLSAMMVISIGATLVSATYAESTSTYTSDAAYWEAKKIDSQNKSTQMRKEYYEKYKSK